MAQETIDRLLDRLNRERIGAETKMQCVRSEARL